MTKSLLDILARLVIICLDQLVIEIILLKLIITVITAGLFLEQHVMHTMMQPVIHIIHALKVERLKEQIVVQEGHMMHHNLVNILSIVQMAVR